MEIVDPRRTQKALHFNSDLPFGMFRGEELLCCQVNLDCRAVKPDEVWIGNDGPSPLL
jgi:hypothetical protein